MFLKKRWQASLLLYFACLHEPRCCAKNGVIHSISYIRWEISVYVHVQIKKKRLNKSFYWSFSLSWDLYSTLSLSSTYQIVKRLYFGMSLGEGVPPRQNEIVKQMCCFSDLRQSLHPTGFQIIHWLATNSSFSEQIEI